MVRRVLVVVVLALAAALSVPPALAAGGWTRPETLKAACPRDPMNCTTEPAPRIAINAAGAAAVTWVGDDGGVRVAIGGRDGRFGAVTRFERASRPAISISDRGAVTVVWSRAGLLRFVRRAPGHGFTRPAELVPRGSRLGDDFAKAVPEDDGATLVVYVNAYRTPSGDVVTRTRSVVLGGHGRPRPFVAVAAGSPARDGFGSAPDGEVAVATCCTAATLGGAPRTRAVAAHVPGVGWRRVTPPLGPREQVETVALWRGDLALGTIDVLRRGDAGSSGRPALARAVIETGVFGSLLPAPVTRPGLAFGPVAAIDGARRSVLVYQEKNAVKAFSRLAPLYAVTAPRSGTFGARQVLDRGLARFPQVVTYRDGALAAWEGPGSRWGVAVERRGTFSRAPAPPGGPSNVGEDFLRNRDLAAAGRFVGLVWTARDGSIRASIAAGL